MILKKIKRILAFSLLLAMLLSILPPVAFAADGETRWNPIELADITENDTIAITMSKGETTYVLPTTASKQPLGDTATISGNQLVTSGNAEAYGWTITGTSTGYHITTGNSRLYTTSSNNGVRIGDTEAIWIINDNYLYSTNTERFLGVYTTAPDWRCYTSINSNIAGQTLQFWVLDNPTTEPTDPTESTAPACEHENKTTTTVDATCTVPGSTTVTCDDCGNVVETTEIPAPGHDYSYDETQAVAPGCVTDGSKTKVCSRCGDKVVEPDPAVGHSYDNGVCENCGAEEPVSEGGYEMVTSISVGDIVFLVSNSVPTELSEISNTKTKYGVGSSYTDTIQALMPLEVVVGSTEGTFAFMNNGTYLYWTSGNSLATNDALSPNTSWTVSFDAVGNAIIANSADASRIIWWNNTNPRFACYTDKEASDQYRNTQFYKYVPAESEEPSEPEHTHDWGEGEVTTEPTCQTEGVRTYTCSGCGETKTEPIAAPGHNHVAGETVAPTCDEEGYTPYTCSNCGDSYKGDTTPATGHTWVDATCTSPSVCSVCDEVGGAFVPVTDINTIEDGDQIVFAVKVGDEHLAPTHELSNNKLVPMMVGVYPNHLNTYDDSLIWEVVKTEGGIALYTDSGYLAHTGAKDTNFKYREEAFTWELRSEETGIHLYSTLSDRAMMLRGETYDGVFGVYATSNLTNADYSGDLLIYKYVPGQSLTHWDSDADNFCNGCGAMLKDAFLISRSISLNGNIAVNFYMALSDKVLADKDAYMLFSQEGKDPVMVSIADSIARKVRNTDAYAFTYEVSAKEMTDIITAQLFYGDTSTEEYTYSVKEYADSQREKLSDKPALMNLLDAMLRYGAASQIQFKYHTDRLADAGMEAVDYSNLEIYETPNFGTQGTDLVTFAGASLLLKSETTLRFFFSVDASVENLTITYEGQSLAINTRNGLYYADVENISAPDLNALYSITVDDGVQTATVTCSPMTYCNSVYNNASGVHPVELRNVAAALILYNRAADNYFFPNS